MQTRKYIAVFSFKNGGNMKPGQSCRDWAGMGTKLTPALLNLYTVTMSGRYGQRRHDSRLTFGHWRDRTPVPLMSKWLQRSYISWDNSGTTPVGGDTPGLRCALRPFTLLWTSASVEFRLKHKTSAEGQLQSLELPLDLDARCGHSHCCGRQLRIRISPWT